MEAREEPLARTASIGPRGEDRSHRGGNEREHRVLRDELPRDAGAARAEGGPDSDLGLSPGEARMSSRLATLAQAISSTSTTAPNTASGAMLRLVDHLCLERLHRCADARVRLRILHRQSVRDRLEVRPRRGDRDAWLQTDRG